jgi:hypothetical protein
MFRWNSHLRGRERVEVQVARDNALVKLAALDERLRTITIDRLALLRELEELRDELWPPMLDCRVARPPAFDVPPIPPAPADAIPVTGKHLRWICLILLARHGMQELRDIHALLHQHGYTIGHHHPVKALADALRFEVEKGRAQRVRRGVYALSEGFRPKRGRHGHPSRLDDDLADLADTAARAPGAHDHDDRVDPHTSEIGPAHVDPDIHIDPDQWPEYPGFRFTAAAPGPPPLSSRATTGARAPRSRRGCPTGSGRTPRAPAGAGPRPTYPSDSRS